jgi:hypothetical protein
MNRHRLHLLNNARRALLQRGALRRSSAAARANLSPDALKQRAKRHVADKVERGTAATEAGLRKYAVPLGAVAAAGLLFAFRRPLADAIDAALNLLERQNADAATAETNPAEPEQDHEQAGRSETEQP